jgi:hypothetical protein
MMMMMMMMMMMLGMMLCERYLDSNLLDFSRHARTDNDACTIDYWPSLHLLLPAAPLIMRYEFGATCDT